MIVVEVVLLGIAFLFRSQLGSLIAQLGGRIREIRLGTLAVTFEGELKEAGGSGGPARGFGDAFDRLRTANQAAV